MREEAHLLDIMRMKRVRSRSGVTTMEKVKNEEVRRVVGARKKISNRDDINVWKGSDMIQERMDKNSARVVCGR